jgi:hypothetical protein
MFEEAMNFCLSSLAMRLVSTVILLVLVVFYHLFATEHGLAPKSSFWASFVCSGIAVVTFFCIIAPLIYYSQFLVMMFQELVLGEELYSHVA